MAQKTKAQLDTVNAAIDTNGVNAITGAIHHGMNKDLIDSVPTYEDDASKLRQVEAKKNISLTGGVSTLITFDNPIAFGSYSLQVRCLDSSGNSVDFQIPYILETPTGFTITPAIDCLMTYTATKI